MDNINNIRKQNNPTGKKPKWYFDFHPGYQTWDIFIGKVNEMGPWICINIRLGIIDFGRAYY